MLPRGFKLNTYQTLKHTAINDDEYYYTFSDADGTEHCFFKTDDGTYRDEDGLGLKLEEYTSGNISITDSSKTVKHFQKFSTTWILRCINDINGNDLLFTYSDKHKITKISLIPNGSNTLIDLLEFTYSNTPQLLHR